MLGNINTQRDRIRVKRGRQSRTDTTADQSSNDRDVAETTQPTSETTQPTSERTQPTSEAQSQIAPDTSAEVRSVAQSTQGTQFFV